MKSLAKISVLCLIIVSSLTSVAKILVYPFDDVIKEQRFNALIKELRCPKCQNNNLAGSNSPLSLDLKDIIYVQIKAGKTDKEIEGFLKDRYGDFISYRPPLNPSTWIIWFGPFVVLLIGGFSIFRFISSRQNNQNLVSETSKESSVLLKEWVEDSEEKTS